jgi:hypothetical protein
MAFIDREYDLDAASAEISVAGDVFLTISYEDFSPEIIKQGFLYGITKKMVDSVAGIKAQLARERGVETSQIDNSDPEYIQAVKDGLKEIYDQLRKDGGNEWRAARGEGEAKPRVTELAEAISRIRGMSLEEAAALVKRVAEQDKEKLSTWRKHPQVQLAIAQIRQERAAARLAAAMKSEPSEFDPFAS